MVVQPIIFFSRCLIKKELRYGSFELEVVCLVWVCKRLRTLLYSNNYYIVVFINHNSICRIVYHGILNTIFTDCINRRFINMSVYLSVYLFDIYYISNRLNYIFNVLLYFRIVGDKVMRKSFVKPVLNVF